MKHNKKKRHNADDVKIEVTAKPIENDGVLITPAQQKMVECVDILAERAADVYGGMDKLANNGWGLAINADDKFVLNANNNPAFASLWPSVAYAFNADYNKVKAAPTLIVNTSDLGFVHVAPTEDKKDTEILGPVINPCLVGSVHSPLGILVPFAGGKEALRAGRFMIDSFLNTDSNHECICDGNCNCNGDCNCENEDDNNIPYECTGSELLW